MIHIIKDMMKGVAVASLPKLLLKASGSTFADASSNAYALTLDGSSAPSADAPFAGEKSLLGTGRAIINTTGVNLNPGTGDWTVRGWVKLPLNHVDGASIMYSRAFSGNWYHTLYVNNNGSVEGWANHTAARIVTASGLVNANAWTHLAYVRSGAVITLYVGGVARGTVSATGLNLNSTNTTPAVIGGTHHTTFQQNNGRVYDVEVNFSALYTGNFTPPTAPTAV
jgi:hypothetical protein